MSADPIPGLKEQAAAALVSLLERWSGGDAAALIGVERERVVELRRGSLDRFSLERLIRFLVRAGARVELRIAPRLAEPRPERDR
jgi:predicted XRE-type DNA-binding protein